MNSIKDLTTYVLKLENEISIKIKNELLIRIERIEEQISNEIKKFERFIKQNLLIDSGNKLKLSKRLINDNYCEKCSNFLKISPEKKANNCFLCFNSLNNMSPDHILFCSKCNLNICFTCVTTPDFHLINLPCEKCELECEFISKTVLSDNLNPIICNVCFKSEKLLEYFICKKCNFLICHECDLHCRKELFLDITGSKANYDLPQTNNLYKKPYLDYLRSRKIKANKLMEIQFTIARYDKTLISNHSRSYSSYTTDNKIKEQTISNFSENTVASSFLNSNVVIINEATVYSDFTKFSTNLNLNDNESINDINEEKIIRYKSIASALLNTTDNKDNNANTLTEENKNISTKYDETINSPLKKDISHSPTISNGPKQYYDNDNYLKINVEDKIKDKLIENSMVITEKNDNNEKSNINKNDELSKKTNDQKISNNIYEQKEKFLSKEDSFEIDLDYSNKKIYLKITEFEKKFKDFCFTEKMNEIIGLVISFLNEIHESKTEEVLISNGDIDNYPKGIKLIGSGSYGDVYELSSTNLSLGGSKKKVMKCFKINDNDLNATYYSLNSFFREWKNLRILEHRNIIAFYGIGYKLIHSTKKLIEVGLILENLPSTLSNFLKFDKLIEETIPIINQLVIGLNHIHSKNKIHRDIKPNNILISNSNIIKIIDFGTISEPINPLFETIMDDVFTRAYGPPEFIRYYYLNEDVPLDYGNDIWSLGLTIIEIIFKTNYIFPWVQLINEIMDIDKLTKTLRSMEILNKKDEFEKYLDRNFNYWLVLKLNKLFKNNNEMISNFYPLIFRCFSFKAENRIKTDEMKKIINDIINSLSNQEQRTKSKYSPVSKINLTEKHIGEHYIYSKKGEKRFDNVELYEQPTYKMKKRLKKNLDSDEDEYEEKNQMKVQKKFNSNSDSHSEKKYLSLPEKIKRAPANLIHEENFVNLREDLKKLIKRKDIFKK